MKRVRINDQIRGLAEVRLIGAEGHQVGVVSLEEANRLAEAADLDLVEVAPEAKPPVCRIMDYGKFKFEQKRKEREAHRKQKSTTLKEIKMKPKIDDHDFDFKKRHVQRFLGDGHKVKVSVMFRGREMAHPQVGMDLLNLLAEQTKDVGHVESLPRQEGRHMIMIMAPNKENKPKSTKPQETAKPSTSEKVDRQADK